MKEATSPTRSSIGDFSILPISFPPTRAYPKAVLHHVYVRRNAPKIPTPDDDRSLFLANVPVDSTEAHFRAVFAALAGAGKFESISFEDDRRRRAAESSSVRPSQALRLAQTAHGSSKKRKRGEAEEEEEEDDQETARTLFETWPRRLHGSGGTAVVLLADERSVSVVLKAVGKVHKSKKYPVWGAGVEESAATELGAPWLRDHNRLCFPNKAVVQSAVDSFFILFNKREKEAAELAKRMRSEPDEDGFVTVVRGAGRSAPARRDEAEEARRRLAEREERKRQELGGFYRFQLREQKKAEQADLIRRFEEDRKKVSAMREKKGKFKPEA